jgi:hypothetical protein
VLALPVKLVTVAVERAAVAVVVLAVVWAVAGSVCIE